MAQPEPLFWVLKIVTTGMGETTSDFLVRTFPPEFAVAVAFLVLVAVLVLQLRTGGYQPGRYWLTALMVSVFGTMAADVLHVVAGVPYAASAAGFAVVLAGLFLLWWRSERILSVHQITSPRREVFYWSVVAATFALGTAVGDFTAATLRLGYLESGALFALAFAVPGVLWGATRRGAVALFWAAYVLTRPLGASFADWFAVAPSRGGLDLGTGAVSVVLLAVFLVLVLIASLRRRRQAADDSRAAAGGVHAGGR